MKKNRIFPFLKNIALILFLYNSTSYYSAQALVQAATNNLGSTNTVTAKFGANTTSGNLIIVNVAWDNAARTISSVTDDKFNVYHQLLANTKDNSNSFITELWYAYDITGGTKITVTAKLSGNSTSFFQLYTNEFSGIYSAGDPIDQSSFGKANNGAATISTTAKATTYANEFIYGIELNSGSIAGSVGAGFTNISQFDNNEEEYQVISATGLHDATFNLSAGTGDMVALMAIFNTTSTLPIRLISFNANYNNNAVNLSWTTASETNNKVFNVEKTIDGMNWQYVAEIAGAGNSDQTLNYIATDETPYTGISYYRLKQTDYDGDSSYSSVISVEVNLPELSLTIIPNPIRNICTIAFTQDVNETSILKIYDCTGREVLAKTISAVKGPNIITEDFSVLPQGFYIITLQENGNLLKKEFIKE